MPSLQERLDEFKKAFESGAPPYNAPREAVETIIGLQPNSRLLEPKIAR
jgi:hypothetical protein